MRASLVRALWLVAALLALAAAAELAWPGEAAAPVAPPQPVAEAGGALPTEPVAAWATASVARPLFTPGRRPDAPGAAFAESSLGRPEPPRLTGIMLGPTERRALFAAAAAGGRITVVGEGGTVGAWRVQAIRAGEVQLAGPDGDRVVRPAYSDAPTPLPQALSTDTRSPAPQAPFGASVLTMPVPAAPRTSP